MQRYYNLDYFLRPDVYLKVHEAYWKSHKIKRFFRNLMILWYIIRGKI